jgi:hypothetical protein
MSCNNRLLRRTPSADCRGGVVVVVVIVVVEGSVGALGWLNEWGCLWGQYESSSSFRKLVLEYGNTRKRKFNVRIAYSNCTPVTSVFV